MNDLTLVIPAKRESESLPTVLKELKKFKIKILVVLEKQDLETINSIKKFNCKILYQKNKGYGDALILGIKNVKTKYFCIFNADGSFDENDLPKRFTGMNTDYKDSYKSGKILQFDSAFESGNLDRVVMVSPNEYDLYMRPDTNTKGHHQWFYFRAISKTNLGPVKFNILNFTK